MKQEMSNYLKALANLLESIPDGRGIPDGSGPPPQGKMLGLGKGKQDGSGLKAEKRKKGLIAIIMTPKSKNKKVSEDNE